MGKDVGRSPGHVTAVEHDTTACVVGKESGDGINECRLASSVWTDQAGQLASATVERDIVNRQQASEGTADSRSGARRQTSAASGFGPAFRIEGFGLRRCRTRFTTWKNCLRWKPSMPSLLKTAVAIRKKPATYAV